LICEGEAHSVLPGGSQAGTVVFAEKTPFRGEFFAMGQG